MEKISRRRLRCEQASHLSRGLGLRGHMRDGPSEERPVSVMNCHVRRSDVLDKRALTASDDSGWPEDMG